MIRNNKFALALAGLVALTTSAALADEQAIIDALVRKGILSQKDAEQIESTHLQVNIENRKKALKRHQLCTNPIVHSCRFRILKHR